MGPSFYQARTTIVNAETGIMVCHTHDNEHRFDIWASCEAALSVNMKSYLKVVSTRVAFPDLVQFNLFPFR